MNNQRLTRALDKLGLKIEERKNMRWVSGEAYTCSWYVQGDNAICVNVRRHSDHHDSQSDYTAGFFARTIKDACKWVMEN